MTSEQKRIAQKHLGIQSGRPAASSLTDEQKKIADKFMKAPTGTPSGALTYADVWGDDVQEVKASIRDNLRAKSVAQRRQEPAGQKTNGMSMGMMPTYESGQNESNIMKAFREADAQNWLDNIKLLDSGAANDIEYKNLGQEASVKGTFLKMRADQLMEDYETLTHAGAVSQNDADSFNQRLNAFKKDAGDYNTLLTRINILSGSGGNIVKDFHEANYGFELQREMEDKQEELLNLRRAVTSNWRTPETAAENRRLYDEAKAELERLQSELSAWESDQDEQAREDLMSRLSSVSEAEDYEQAIAALDWDDIDMPLIGTRSGLNEKLQYATDEEYRAERDEDRPPVYPELYYMTDDERNVLSYYVSRGDYAKANEYLNELEYMLNARKRAEDQAWQTAQAYEHPLLAALTTNVIGSWFSPLAYIATAGQEAKNFFTGEDEPVDPNSFWFDGAHLAEDTRQGVHKAVRDESGDGFWGDAAAFGADTGLSLLQYGSMLPLGPTGALALMSMGSAGQTATDALERGATTGQAFALGTASGVIEAATEKIPLDNLSRLAKQGARGVRPAVTSVLKQAGIEGTEEMISEIAGNVADIVVMKDASNYKQYVEYLRSLGYSQKHAEEEATLQYFIYGTGLAGLGGFVSGGVMGGGAVTLGNLWNGTQIDVDQGHESLLRDGADAGKMDAALELWMGTTEGKGTAGSEIADPESYELWQKAFLGQEPTIEGAGDVNFDRQKLIDSGNQLDKGGELTKAGRALEKHGSRSGSIFPQATGNVANKNALGNQTLKSILNNPNATSVIRYHAMYGNILEIKIPGGMGARFSADGSTFIGFLE